MKILFTGASSFTGYWFVRELAAAGHTVVATFRKRPEEYQDDLRRQRVTLAMTAADKSHFGCSFGDNSFLDLARSDSWDLLCHHAADVTNYRSPDFDIAAALTNNTRNAAAVMAALHDRANRSTPVLLTGSIFENDEGAGSQGRPAFSPYGLSKSFTHQVFRYEAARAGVPLAKFVIPNPFGPYEEPRFTSYLMKTWFAGQAAAVNTPAYVRDNIHVSLLAKVYAQFAAEFTTSRVNSKLHPSGYAESQGAFTQRFANEMRSRLGIPCEVSLNQQVEFLEPRVRINTDPPDGKTLGWNECHAWDEIAKYYKDLFSAKSGSSGQQMT